MVIRKIIQGTIERRERGLDLQANVNAVIATNVGEDGWTHVASHQSVSSSGRKPRREAAYPKEEAQCVRLTPSQIREMASPTG